MTLSLLPASLISITNNTMSQKIRIKLKSYDHTLVEKSAEKIVNDMAAGQAPYVTLFDTEFRALTKIGNDFRIRHHETDKVEITDVRYYDYFFNRCLSLIALAIQYLQ